MPWNPAHFHPSVFSVLQAQSGKHLPLSSTDFQPQPLPPDLLSTNVELLFPQARDAKAALSGLLLFAGHWEQSHRIAQDVSSAEGSYWHAIVHRIEPDSFNSTYWFQRVGEHPIFPSLNDQATTLLASYKLDWQIANSWHPKTFIKWCDEARLLPGSTKQTISEQIQTIECQLLLAWCAMKTKDF